MSKIETPADACAALALLIAGADNIGTIEEGRFLFGAIADMPIFADLDRDRFAGLMADTAEWIWTSYASDDNRITDEGISELIDLIAAALPGEHRVDAVRAAVGLARSDGMVEPEEALLRRLCEGLDIDPDTSEELLA